MSSHSLNGNDATLDSSKHLSELNHGKQSEQSPLDQPIAVDLSMDTTNGNTESKTADDTTECETSIVPKHSETDKTKSITKLEFDSGESKQNVVSDDVEQYHDAEEMITSPNLNIVLNGRHANKDFQIPINQSATIDQLKEAIKQAQNIDEFLEHIKLVFSNSADELCEINDSNTTLFDNKINDQYIVKVKIVKENQHSKKTTDEQLSIASRFASAKQKMPDSDKEKNSSTIVKTLNNYQSKQNRLPHGACGLENIGSTCYMNSALQCISNVSNLTEYFLEGTFRYHLNRSNVLGTQGEVALAYSELINKVWSGDSCPFTPYSLKRSVARHAPQFADFRQQDSQEFMNFLLDALHEDLKLSDNDYDNDNSIIAQLFHSKMRSTVQCPTCPKPETIFSNVCFLPLPIPSRQSQHQQKQAVDSPSTAKKPRRLQEHIREIIFVNTVGIYTSYEVKITENASISNLIDTFFEKYESQLDYKCDHDNIIVALLCENNFKGKLNPSKLLSEVPKHYTIALYQLLDNVNSNDRKLIRCDFQEYENSSAFRPPIYISHSKNNSTIEMVCTELEKALPHALSISSRIKLVIEDQLTKYRNKEPFERYRIYLVDKTKSFDSKLLHITINYDCTQVKVQAATAIVNNYNSNQNYSTTSIATSTTTTLEQCIQEFLEPEKLGANGQWYCNTCNRFTDATKKLDFDTLAPILIMQLKRFSFNRTSSEKTDTFIDYPIIDFDMKKFATNSSGKSTKYNLIAVSNHSGSLSSGHYTTSAKNPNNDHWYHFNDSSVTPIEVSAVITRNAYVLVYSRE